MKQFDKLVEKLRKELTELAMEKGNLSDEELVQKSQELDEVLNSFYSSARSKRQDCAARTCKTIKKKQQPGVKSLRVEN